MLNSNYSSNFEGLSLRYDLLPMQHVGIAIMGPSFDGEYC